MLELRDVALLITAKPQEKVLLGDVNASIHPGQLVAVVGLPGSGKSTLLKLLAGICRPTFGEVIWTEEPTSTELHEGYDTPAHSLIPFRPVIGYIPQQFPEREDLLTVAEQVQYALRLRVAGLRKTDYQERVRVLLEKTGLTPFANSRGGVLSADQKRRLDLAIELTGSPLLLLCDESNHPFDPKTESDFAKLLLTQAREESCAVVHVTQALNTLEEYDAVIVIHGGQLIYHGPPEFLTHYFQIDSPTELFEQLSHRRAEDWHRSWVKHGQAYRFAEEGIVNEISNEARQLFQEKLSQVHETRIHHTSSRLPNGFSQFFTLLLRRIQLAWRNPSRLWLQLALLFGFPSAVVVFASGSVNRLLDISEALRGNVIEQLKENAVFAVDATYSANLVAGLAMAQTILLAFLAAQNASREISGERTALEREKLSGLSTQAYIGSKIAFLLPGVVLQSVWMGWFIHHVCRLPGNPMMQIVVLMLAYSAFTAVALGISSLARSLQQAQLICFSIATLQLPFSGVILAPPDALSWLLRPLVALYWTTSAYLQTTSGTRFHEVLQIVSPFTLCPLWLCFVVLGIQVLLGIMMTISGCKIARMGITRKHLGT